MPHRVTCLNEGVLSYSYFVFMLFSYLFPQKASPAPLTPKGSGVPSRGQHLWASLLLWTAWTCLYLTVDSLQRVWTVNTCRLRLQWASKAFILDNYQTLIQQWWCLNSSGNPESQQQLTWFQLSVQASSSLELTEVPESCLSSSQETVKALKPEKKYSCYY